jgi:hypothetical protein
LPKDASGLYEPRQATGIFSLEVIMKTFFFRNRKDIEDIPADSLWQLSEDNSTMMLVDDDEFITAIFDPDNFYRVELSESESHSLMKE